VIEDVVIVHLVLEDVPIEALPASMPSTR